MNVGAVRFTEDYSLGGVVSEEQLQTALKAISGDLSRLDGRPLPDALVGMGGANTNLAAVKHKMATYDADVIQGSVLEGAEVERQIELYRTSSLDDRRKSLVCNPSARM